MAGQTTEPAQVLVYIDGAIADPERVVLPLTHTAGGSDPTTQPNAPSLVFDWLGPLSFTWGQQPYDLTIGARIGLTLDQAGGGLWDDIWTDLWSPALPPGTTSIPPIVRFTGRITDLDTSADMTTLRTTITAIGTSGEASTYQVGGSDLPAQTENARVTAIGAPAPYPVVNQGGAVNLLARLASRTGLLDALAECAENTGARVYENGAGQIVYLGLDARKAATVGVSLQDYQILSPVSWAQHVAGLVNDVTVFYGPDPVAPATIRASVNVENVSSKQAFGRQHVDIETQLTTDDDALSFGAVVLAHWAFPFWDAPQVIVRADTLDQNTWKALMETQLSQAVITEGMTGEPSTPSGEGKWLLEGWVQTWDRDDNGRLTDTLQLAVSEYSRWVSDGKQPTETTATVTPNPVAQLSPTTVTATVTSQGVPVTAGTVEVWDGSTLLGSGAVGAGGIANVVVKPNRSGTIVLTVKYAGTAVFGSSDTALTLTVTPVTATAVTIAASDTSVRNGDDVVLTATVTPAGVTGSIRWELDRHDGAGWVDWTGHDSPVNATTGKATATWTTSTTPTVSWRARYIPTPGTTFAGATSGSVTVTVAQKSTQTLTYSAASGATYQQDGDKRTDVDDLYQGYYSGTNGNQRSIAMFSSMAGDWGGATITKVEVYLVTPHWQSASGGTAVIGSYSGSSLPGSWPSSGVNDDRTRSAFDRGQGKWVNITDWGKGFATAALRGIVLGPGPSTGGEYYGYATGTGSDRPKIRITGDVWT